MNVQSMKQLVINKSTVLEIKFSSMTEIISQKLFLHWNISQARQDRQAYIHISKSESLFNTRAEFCKLAQWTVRSGYLSHMRYMHGFNLKQKVASGAFWRLCSQRQAVHAACLNITQLIQIFFLQLSFLPVELLNSFLLIINFCGKRQILHLEMPRISLWKI